MNDIRMTLTLMKSAILVSSITQKQQRFKRLQLKMELPAALIVPLNIHNDDVSDDVTAYIQATLDKKLEQRLRVVDVNSGRGRLPLIFSSVTYTRPNPFWYTTYSDSSE